MQPTTPDPGVPFKVVVVYEDVAAGQRAVALMTKLLRGFSDDVDFQPVLWRFDLLNHIHWHKRATTDTADADMLVLSTSSSSELPEAVNRWLEAGIALKRDDRTALVVLQGPEEAWTISINENSKARLIWKKEPAPNTVVPLPLAENLLAKCG